ncbi:hypothetical protein [Jatrophihabitans fulvus]
MIPRPATDELIADVCRELMEHVLPALDDDTLKVRVVMAETVLRNAAVRAAHEIAWLRDETDALRAYAVRVTERYPSDAVAGAVAALDAGPQHSLHLADVVTGYELAGAAFDAARSLAREHGDAELLDTAHALLRARVDTEKQVMATYAIVGR